MSDSNKNNTAEVEIMVASLVEVFYDQNGDRNVTPTAKLQTCCKTLRILIQNAVTKPAEDRYRQVRLDNAKIQERVANVPGAVDLLQSAGFVKQSDDQGLLRYAPEDAAQAAQVGRALVAALDLKLQQLQRVVAVSSKQQQQPPTATSSQKQQSQQQQSPFLSEEERHQRYLRAKQLRKQRAAERDLTKQRFREDQQDRTERLKNQERAKRAAAAAAAEATTDSAVGPQANDNEEGGMQVAPAGVFIRRHQPNAAAAADGETKHTPPQRLPTPMEPAAARTPPVAPAAAAAAAAQARAAGGGGMTTTTTPPSAAAAAAAALDDAMETDAAVTKKQRLFGESSSSSPAPAATDSMDVEDQKLPAKPSTTTTSETEDAAAVAAYLKRLPRCGAAAGIRDTSTYRHQASSLGSASAQRPACLKKLLRELKELDENLPSQPAIWVRFDEEQPQFLRALIAAPTGTPYAHGLFAFDVYLPDRYPAVPPNVQLLTTGGGTVRFGPNLYANGKCCLSLLGTWPGPKWNPLHSSLFQVLVSIQGLILGVEHPFYLEPGHGGWEGNVKAEGEFAMTGKMLSTGKVVRTEIGVPPEIVDYDNRLRVGTIRYAMLDTMQGAAEAANSGGGGKSSILGKHLSMFQPVIAAHFYHSRQAIVEETQQWLSTASAAGTKTSSSSAPSNVMMLDPSSSSSAATTHQELVKCVGKLQDKLSHLTPPPEAALALKDNDETMETVDDVAPTTAAAAPVKPAPTAAAAAPKQPPSRDQNKETTAMDVDQENDGGVVALIAKKQREMEQAAAQGDYVAAGKLQTEVQHLQDSKTQLQDLERRMAQAAAAQDFIKAGRFQEQYQALLDAGGDAAAATNNNNMMWDQGEGVPGGGGGGGGDFDDDDDSDMGGGPPFAAGAPAGFPGAIGGPHHLAAAVAKGKHVFAPPGVRLNSGAAKNHAWGSGSALQPQAAPQQGDNDDNDSTTAEALKPAAAAVKKAPIPPERLCRLKFRLPEKSRTVLEAFDQNDPLSTVYTYLETLVVPGGPSSTSAQQGDAATNAAASLPPPVNARFGAFSQPLSSAGFTLLLSHPKREFNLEMHGTKTLEELNLAPSATLTVMRCHERGVVHRGELQSRLDQAEGGAMDLDGLTYEGLMELTERVGNAAPPQGAVSLTLSQHDLDANSILLSPCSLLSSPGAAALSEEEQKCPICLGQYAAEDKSPCLRKLKACGHVFHDSCLTTWLRSKSSCPLCKADIVVDEK